MSLLRTTYLSLGSNIGDRAAHIARAVAALNRAGVRVVRQSSLYRTQPVDFRPQGWFLNCVVEAQTRLMPRQLLHTLRAIERRESYKLVRRGPRALDIDILLYGQAWVRSAELVIPHPRMRRRRFVLVPLAEVAPRLRHAALGGTIAAMLAHTADHSRVARWSPPKEQRVKE